MGPGRETGQQPEEESPGRLAQAILRRIADGDMPGGLELEPERVGAIFGATPQQAALALEQLESAGATVRVGDNWMVRIDRKTPAAEFLNRAGPLMRAITSLAASRITPSEAAGLLAAYDRAVGLAGDGAPDTRASAYALYMRRLAAASGSSFHVLALDLMLAETAPVLEQFFARADAGTAAANFEDELAWLARALMGGDAARAAEALDKHLLAIAQHLSASPAG